MTLAQWSNLFVYAAIGFYLLAMFSFAVSFAAPRGRGTTASGRTPALAAARSASGRTATASSALAAVQASDELLGDPSVGDGPRLSASTTNDGIGVEDELPPGRRSANIGMSLTWLAFGFLAVAVLLRGMWAGRAPWGNMYEFALASALAVTGVFLLVSIRRDVRWLGLLITMAVLLTLGVAVLLLYNESAQLVPALQSYWLVIHVSAAIVAGGAFTVGAAAAALYLVRERAETRAGWSGAAGHRTQGGPIRGLAARLPESEVLDGLSYRVNAFVFPLWTFAVVAGAIWAEDAWGRYWGWDPKETWAFITWVIYAGYLHARSTAGWGGRRAALIGLAGFAAFLINFFGVNLMASGLHSYAGV